MIPKTERRADVLILGGLWCMGAVAAIKKGCRHPADKAWVGSSGRVLSPPAISSTTTLSRTTCTNGWNGGIRPETACSMNGCGDGHENVHELILMLDSWAWSSKKTHRTLQAQSRTRPPRSRGLPATKCRSSRHPRKARRGHRRPR